MVENPCLNCQKTPGECHSPCDVKLLWLDENLSIMIEVQKTLQKNKEAMPFVPASTLIHPLEVNQ